MISEDQKNKTTQCIKYIFKSNFFSTRLQISITMIHQPHCILTSISKNTYSPHISVHEDIMVIRIESVFGGS